MKAKIYIIKNSTFLFFVLVFCVIGQTDLSAQCFVEDLSPSSFSFTDAGGTQTNSIVYTNGSCTYSLSFSNIPSWITSVTQPNSYQVVVTCQANLGGSRNALINYSYNGMMQSFAVTQAANPNPPPAPGTPTIVANSNSCGQATLQRTGNPGSGVTWYWQGTNASGTNTAASVNAVNNNYTVTQSGTYYIRARGSNGLWSAATARAVTVINFEPGVILANNATICYGGDPPTIGSFEEASGSNGSHTYQWESSVNNGPWNDITTSANGSTYNPPAGLTSNTRYRRKASCGSQEEYSNIETVTVRPPLGGGTISNPPDICSGEDPVALGGTLATNGEGGYGYQWEWATVGSNSWNDISGAIVNSYNPPILTQSRKYRRRATSCGQTAYSNEVVLTVNPTPGNATGNNVSRCNTGTVTLTAVLGSNANQIKWYTAATGGSEITAGVSANTLSYTTPSISSSTTYYAQSYNNTTGCFAATRTPIQAQVQTLLTWFLDADGDGSAISFTDSCSSPGSGYTSNTLPLGDCDDDDPNIQEAKVWYDDTDGDGLGDPALPSTPSCTAPANHVDNSNDQCPGIDSPTNQCSVTVSSDPQDHNYVYTRTYQQESTTTIDPQFFTQNDALVQQITFVDGLGRPYQQVGIAQSPNVTKDDIVTYIGYDAYGRQEKEWLPYVDTDQQSGIGIFRTEASSENDAYYQLHYSDDITLNAPNPFSQKEFESSPLNRVFKQAAPGSDWAMGNGHEIEFEYLTNAAEDDVKQYEVDLNFVDNTYEPTLAVRSDNNGEYVEGELFKNITKDENHDGTTTKLHTTEEFTDKQGRVVLKRTYALVNSSEEAHDTYYIYDDFGNLTYVLPPKMDASSETLANINTNMNELGYQYVYDHRNRLVEKRIPGKDWEYIVYNKLDQPILTQDANQREKDANSDEWLFTKYDAFGRVAYTGMATTAENKSRADIQTEVDALSGNLWVARSTQTNFGDADISYDDGAYPTATTIQAQLTEILTINYYDNHDFDRANEGTPPTSVFNVAIDARTQGLDTGSKVKVLDVTPAQWITTITRYDAKGRPIYTYSENEYLGTVDIVETLLDFVGKPLKVKSTHIRNSNTIVTLGNFEYDHVGRLLKQTQCVGDETLGDSCAGASIANLVLTNATITTDQSATTSITVEPTSEITSGVLRVTGNGGQEELIALNEYDELGQLVKKKVGNTEASPLQEVDYTYNVRGWLKAINQDAHADNDLFNFGINYNTVAHGGTALFNGNIAETQWETINDNQQRWYSYTYDALNRITTGTSDDGKFNLGSTIAPITYDKNGNIGKLLRMGHVVASPDIATANDYGTMDDLTYTYVGNKLMKVADAANVDQFGFKDDAVNTVADGTDDYTYDANGNMTMDLNKGIQADGITYNHLNLPTLVTLPSGTISYIYDAAGTKLKKTAGSSVTEYANGYVYSGNTSSTALQFFNHPEGYTYKDGSAYKYVYQYKDHLGNIRLSYEDGNDNGSVDQTEIVEENNYYPFGLKHKGYNDVTSSLGNSVANKWKFGGKELDDSFNDALATYDFGARNYSPDLGRWMNIDPYANKYISLSPYNYAANNPLFFVDPNGKEIIINGSRKERRQIFRNLKKLTNDRLKLNRKTGLVTIGKGGVRNKGVNLKTGTGIVSNLVKSKHTTNIISREKFRNDNRGKKDSYGDDLGDSFGNQTKTNTTLLDQVGGPGGDAEVIFDLNDNGDEIMNEDGTFGRPIEIGLAHELIHADRITSGTVEIGQRYEMQNTYDFDSKTMGQLSIEELNVRFIENDIREEMGIKPRKEPENRILDDLDKLDNNNGK